MTWFKVDDSFHSHPKALTISLAAIGLWSVSGSWSGGHLTDGFVPDTAVLSLSRGSTELAEELVAAGLWRRTKGGYRFHQWAADSDGTPRNPTRSEAKAARSNQSSGGAIGNHRRWHLKRNMTDPKCRYCQQKQASGTRSETDQGTDGVPESHPNPPTRPDPVLSSSYFRGESPESNARAKKDPPRQPRCEQHQHLPDDDPGPNCRACRDARLANEQKKQDRRTQITEVNRRCDLCDIEGWRYEPGTRVPLTPYERCDHRQLRSVS